MRLRMSLVIAYRYVGRTLHSLLGLATLSAVVLGTFDYTGGSFRPKYDPNFDKAAYKEAERKKYRRPMEDTIAQLGEGRGEMILG
jgi:hypothetical protein